MFALMLALAFAPGARAAGVAGADTDTAGLAQLELVAATEGNADGSGIELTYVPVRGLDVGVSIDRVQGPGGTPTASSTGHRFELSWVPWQVERGAVLTLRAEAGGDLLKDRVGHSARDRVAQASAGLGWRWSDEGAVELTLGLARVRGEAGAAQLARAGLALEAPLANRIKWGFELKHQQDEAPSRELRLIFEPSERFEWHVALGRHVGRSSALVGAKWSFGR